MSRAVGVPGEPAGTPAGPCVVCLALLAPRAAGVMLCRGGIAVLLLQVLPQLSSEPTVLCWSLLVPRLLLSGVWRTWVPCRTAAGWESHKMKWVLRV